MSDPRRPIHVAVIIVTHHHRDDVAACLRSLREHWPDETAILPHVVVVDNASTDGTADRVADGFPWVELIRNDHNLGFGPANNLAWEQWRDRTPSPDHLVLLNPDTRVTAGWLEPLVEHLESHPGVAIAQPKIRLMPEHEGDEPRIDTVGNRSHYLGFGFVTGYGEPDRGQHDDIADIGFASGAAMAVRADFVRTCGLFDPALFLYMEDLELGWRARLAGFAIQRVPTSVVLHRHDPRQTLDHLDRLEFGRLWVLGCYYRWPTWLVLAPLMPIMEMGVLAYAACRGRLRDKLASYAMLGRLSFAGAWRARRRAVQSWRRARDREVLRHTVNRLDPQLLPNPLLRWVANPLVGVYGWLVRGLIRW